MWCPLFAAGVVGGVWMLPLLGLALGVLCLVVVRRAGENGGAGPGPRWGCGHWRVGGDTPVTIARRRFAAGQITREELDEIMAALKGRGA